MPAYLVNRNRRIQKELDKIHYEEEHKESLCKLISEEERQALLNVSLFVILKQIVLNLFLREIFQHN